MEEPGRRRFRLVAFLMLCMCATVLFHLAVPNRLAPPTEATQNVAAIDASHATATANSSFPVAGPNETRDDVESDQQSELLQMQHMSVQKACRRLVGGSHVPKLPSFVPLVQWNESILLSPDLCLAWQNEANASHTISTTPSRPAGPSAEGICHPSFGGVFSHLSGDQLRVLDEMDAADVHRTHLVPPRCAVSAFHQTENSSEHPVIKWMCRSRWMFDYFVPFANETALVDAHPQETPYVNVRRSNAKMSFYSVDNLCVSSAGGGLSGKIYGDRMIYLGDIQDEKRAKIRNQMFIHPRKIFPTKFVSTPLLLHPVIFQSDNLGHVLYRVLATRNLLGKFQKLRGQDYENTVLGFLVLSSARMTFGVQNKYRVFYQILNRRWFSVLAAPRTSQNSAEVDDLCFRRAFVGWDIVPMYASRHSRSQTVKLQSAYGPTVARFKHSVLSCFGLQNVTQKAVTDQDAMTKKRLIRVTFISRKTRRLLNEREIILALSLRMSSLPGVSGFQFIWRVADFEKVPISQQVEIAANSDILVGVHGTALQWVLVQPSNAVLIEIQYPQYACTFPGVNSPNGRFCEFGQTAMFAQVTHIAHRVSENDVVRCAAGRVRCDIVVPIESAFRLFDQALCALKAGFAGARNSCDALPANWTFELL